MGIYASEIKCGLCGKRHGALFFSLNFSSTSEDYGRCLARSLLLGVLSMRAGITPQKKIPIPNPNQLSVLSPGRTVTIPTPVREYVDDYNSPKLKDLFPND